MSKLDVIITPTAEKDMQNIFDYIAQDNISKAIEIINSFEKRFDSLAMFPESGTAKFKFILRDIRCAIAAGHYQIIYTRRNDVLYILRVLTGYQDLFAIL